MHEHTPDMSGPPPHKHGRPQITLIRNSAIRREVLRVAPVRPDLAAGLRAAIATTMPLLLAGLLHIPELSYASLAGFGAVLCDKGGAYRTRANAMWALTLGGGSATFIGMLASSYPVLSVCLVLGVVVLAGFLRLFGAEATSVGTMIVMSLVVASTRPAPSLTAASIAAGYFMLGGVWAGLISLALWPLRVHRPSRFAIAAALRELGQVALSLIDASADASAQVARREQLGRARTAIELARAQLGSLRKGRLGSSPRGARLLALVEASDLVFGVLVALEDGLAFEPPQNLPQLMSWIEQIATYMQAELLRVAEALEGQQLLQPTAAKSSELEAAIREAAESPDDHEPRILARALERVEQLVELGRAVDDPKAPARARQPQVSELSSEASKWSLVRDHLTLDSAVFRHALRSASAVGATLFVVKALALDHGYWATLTCLVIMQPHGAQTWAKALQRVFGTVIGAAVAFVIATWVADQHIITACVFGFVTIAVALLPLNYGAFTVFLTPAFVLLAETQAGHPDLAWLRITNTLLGAVIALAGSRLLFPLSERDQIRPLLATALVRLCQLVDVVAENPVSLQRVRAARRELGMALLNAEASYQRLLTETGVPPEQSEAMMTLLLYSHRMASGLIAVAFARGTYLHTHLLARAGDLRAALADMRQAIAERRIPAPVPEPKTVSESAERVEGLFEQLAIMRTASLRFQV